MAQIHEGFEGIVITLTKQEAEMLQGIVEVGTPDHKDMRDIGPDHWQADRYGRLQDFGDRLAIGLQRVLGSTRTVYVAAAIGSMGAFEWRHTETLAREALGNLATPDDDTCIRAVDVPAHLSSQGITRYIAESPELWEPKPGERV